MRKKYELITKDIVLAALASALLSAGKQALVAIPNVEIVTLLIMLYAVCFKPQIAFIATAVYILIECFIWGLNTWVVAYLIHWNFLAFATFLLAHVFKIENRFVYLAFTIVVTACFGVLTTAIDAYVSWYKSGIAFEKFFVIIYMRGIYFYVVHVVGNAAFNLVLFGPLRDLLRKLMRKYYGRDVFLKEGDQSKTLKGGQVAEGITASPALTNAGARDTIKNSEVGSDASDDPRE